MNIFESDQHFFPHFGRFCLKKPIAYTLLEEDDGEQWKSIRRGWCLGRPEFKAELLERMEGKLGEHYSGELRRESEQARAERIMTDVVTSMWKALCRGQTAPSSLMETAPSIFHI